MPRPLDRRAFFRRGLRELLAPLADSAENALKVVGDVAAVQMPPSPPADAGTFVRPPGAKPEADFLAACTACGRCADVCPIACIRVDATLKAHVDVDLNPCVVCAGTPCMFVCPTGALVPTRLAQLDMGTAAWHDARCVRTRGEDCRKCVDACPIGEPALALVDGRVTVGAGCVGCGSCQHACPTTPRAITVTPQRLRVLSG